MSAATKQPIETLWEEVRELSLGHQIDHLQSPPTALQFLRDHVSPNKPCLISNALTHSPALSLWRSTAYLREALSRAAVSVHLTPTGRADAVETTPFRAFASAHVVKMPFPDALEMVTAARSGDTPAVVAYLQEQNDCFRNEYGGLSRDVDDHVPWASEALGCHPEAVNIWIGDERSVTSFHKDHYENLYAVICGEKRFLLLPPTDVHRMYIRDYPAAQYRYSKDSGEFTLEDENPRRNVPWCSVDPYPSSEDRDKHMAQFPLYFNGPKPFEVTVKAGQMLYLPSMWFHHVSQRPDDRGLTIAVNYWYDMRFDIKYSFFNFLQSINHSSLSDSAHLELCHTKENLNAQNGSAADGIDDGEEE